MGCEKVLQSALCGRVVGKWYGAYEGSTGRGKKMAPKVSEWKSREKIPAPALQLPL